MNELYTTARPDIVSNNHKTKPHKTVRKQYVSVMACAVCPVNDTWKEIVRSESKSNNAYSHKIELIVNILIIKPREKC